MGKEETVGKKLLDPSKERSLTARLMRFSRSKAARNSTSVWALNRSRFLKSNINEKPAPMIHGNGSHRMSGQFDPTVPGKRVDAIFAFIRIMDFAILTSVLQDNIMLFVNQICDIVHGIADEFHGSANRSNGDSLLMIWQLCGLEDEKIRQMHDMAVAACAKIFIAIKRSIELHEYSSLPPLMQKLPNYQVKLNFGLHRGWAFEGVIGSNLKIDPIYIGPAVNLAEVLEGLNEEYGTSICLSDAVARGCSLRMSAIFRRTDRIRLTSAREIVTIHSLDMDREANLLTKYEIENLVLIQQQPVSENTSKEGKWNRDMSELLRNDKYFLRLREMYENEPLFEQKFKNGYLNYECGEWEIAKGALEETREMLQRRILRDESKTRIQYCRDGPSEALLRYMALFSFVPPHDWLGARQLTLSTV